MLSQTGVILPHTGVVDNQRIADAVTGVIHLCRRVGVDHLDRITVDYQGIFIFENPNSAFKGTVDRIPPQQRSPLLQVVIIFALANHYGPQSQHITPAGLVYQNAGQQSANTAKAIENHILGLGQRLDIRPHNIPEFIADKFIDGTAIANTLVLDHHLAQVEVGGTQLQLGNSFDHGCRIKFR